MTADPTQQTALDHLKWFRAAAPYINAHRAKTFVIAIASEALYHDAPQHIVHDISLLHALGIRLVLVQGARAQINEQLQQLGIDTPIIQHQRVTTQQALPAILSAVGATRLQLEALLSMGLSNSPMYGAKINVLSGNFVAAKPYGIRNGVDFQLTGEVRRIDHEAIRRTLDQEHIVLLSPIGYSVTGEIFNLSATEVATQAAIALGADKLIFLTPYAGAYDTTNQLIPEITVSAAQDILAQDTLSAQPTQLYLKHAVAACQAGVNRCHILSYLQDGGLLGELFTRDGTGTLVSQTQFEEIRPASLTDVVGLLDLLRPLEQQGVLVYRSKERLENEIEHFAVIERDGMIIACAALYPIVQQDNEAKAAEIACVAVHPDYRKSNRGQVLLAYLAECAKKKAVEVLFLLSTRTGYWFIEQGFERVSEQTLPQARLAHYNYERKSQVYRKYLDQ